MAAFRDLLNRAKQGDESAVLEFFSRYRPMIEKASILYGHKDEDLYQSLILAFITAIQKFPM
ncbi:helix-turn-helix domain-containing protein [Gemmiger sp.]